MHLRLCKVQVGAPAPDYVIPLTLLLHMYLAWTMQ